MSRIAIPTLPEAPAQSQPVLEALSKRLGWAPNLFRLMSISPDTLTAFVGLQGSLAKTMDIKTIEAMGMAVSEGSDCEYCLQAHTFVGLRVAKLDPAELALNRQGTSSDPKRAAAVRFAKTVADRRGKVSDSDLADVRAAGFADAEIVAIAGLTAQFLMTNFMNNIGQVEPDFPTDE
jgi:uncharacterized peroxidase-related enzyme